MAKALVGHLSIDPRLASQQAAENRRLRLRIEELEALVLRLSAENDRLLAARADDLIDAPLPEMQPA